MAESKYKSYQDLPLTLTVPEVSEVLGISRAAATETPEEQRILRVAAYCRVSTDDIDQALSIHLQIQQYMKKIKENPNWKYAGCYVDDGFSGTNTDHRQGFQKLMKDLWTVKSTW